MNQGLAGFVAPFRDAVEPPPADEEGPILVVTADGKGVPMRRPAREGPRRHHRRTKGEKANKKQMACVGAVYSIEPFVRTADDILDEVLRDRRGDDRPEPAHKHVWAEMSRDLDGEPLAAKDAVFGALFDDLNRRAAGHDRPVVCLMDGERALWEAQRVYFAEAVGVLDLFHVLERLWTAAHCFHREGSDEAEQFVEDRLRGLLEGRVGYVIGGLRQRLTKHGLTGSRRRTLESVITYLENNRDQMRYDEYIAAGYPIGSGVAEGACRHLVKDRMEQSGMRWTVSGAQAMLHLRATYLNDQWDEFIEDRVEGGELHPDRYGRRVAGPRDHRRSGVPAGRRGCAEATQARLVSTTPLQPRIGPGKLQMSGDRYGGSAGRTGPGVCITRPGKPFNSASRGVLPLRRRPRHHHQAEP
jgi:hypothetical protein